MSGGLTRAARAIAGRAPRSRPWSRPSRRHGRASPARACAGRGVACTRWNECCPTTEGNASPASRPRWWAWSRSTGCPRRCRTRRRSSCSSSTVWGPTRCVPHPGDLPVIAGLDGGSITTVAPSTTASALTSIATGLAPSQHGLVGFRMRVDRTVLNVLRWPNGKGAPDPFTVQRHDAFLGRPVPVVTRREFQHTGIHRRAAPRHALRRLEHGIGAGRALPPARRRR